MLQVTYLTAGFLGCITGAYLFSSEPDRWHKTLGYTFVSYPITVLLILWLL